MELNTIGYAAITALIAGAWMLFSGSKQRTEDGEWGSTLQWGYLLVMIGIFGILSIILAWSFTAVLLTFTLFTGAVWVWAKMAQKEKNTLDNNHFRDYMAGFFPIIAVVFVLRTFVAEPFQIPSSSMRPNLVKGDFILVNKFTYGIRIPVLNSVLMPINKVERGDVAVFNYPIEPHTNYIKRIVAVGGDIIEYKDKVLMVNGKTEHTSTQDIYHYADDNAPREVHEAQRLQAKFNGRQYDILHVHDALPVDIGTVNYYQKLSLSKGLDSGLREHCEYNRDGNGFKCVVPEGKYFAMGDNRDASADSRYWGFVDDHLMVGKAFFVWLNLSDMKRMGSSIE